MKISNGKTGRGLASTVVSLALAVSTSYAVAVGDDPLLSVDAAAGKHAVFKFGSLEQLQTKAVTLEKLGMRMTDIEVEKDAQGELTYLGVWQPGEGKYTVERSDNWSQFTQRWDQLSRAGYRLLDVERVYVGQNLVYHAVYGEGSGAYAMYANTWSDFEAKWKEMSANGLRLVDVDVTNINGRHHYLGVYEPGTGGYAFYSTSSIHEFLDKNTEFQNQKLDLVDVNMVQRSDGSQQFVGVWKAGTGQGKVTVHTSWQSFKKGWVAKAEEGYSLLDFDASPANSDNTYQLYMASYGPGLAKPAGGPNLNEMAQFLEDRFATTVNGMSYAISHNGQLAVAGATGHAQRQPDPTVAMSSDSRSIIASVTKMLTAPLLYNLLDANGLTLDSPVAPWLPDDWARGPGFAEDGSPQVTFGQLLRHESGLAQALSALPEGSEARSNWNTRWDGLRFAVELGTNAGSTRSYQNMNYALMRVLIPSLWSNVGGPVEPLNATNASLLYLDFMDFLVTGNEGIESISCSAQETFPESRMYAFEDFSLSGWQWMALPDDCGGFAQLHLSAKEMTQYWTAVRFNDDIVSDDDRSNMRDRAGLWNRLRVTDGTAYGHAGGWYWNGRETTTCLLEFPNNIVASIILNSGASSGGCASLRDAYNSGF